MLYTVMCKLKLSVVSGTEERVIRSGQYWSIVLLLLFVNITSIFLCKTIDSYTL